MIEHKMPFGKHVGKPVSAVTDTGYLDWFLRLPKLSSGLRRAIRAELIFRGEDPSQLPPDPPFKPVVCRHCDNRDLCITWHEQSHGNRVIRADCDRCGRFVGFLPLTPENVAQADAARSSTGLLDALMRVETERVELVCHDGRIELVGSAGLQSLIRQHQHALLRHLGGR
jgi:hypothetical protein